MSDTNGTHSTADKAAERTAILCELKVVLDRAARREYQPPVSYNDKGEEITPPPSRWKCTMHGEFATPLLTLDLRDNGATGDMLEEVWQEVLRNANASHRKMERADLEEVSRQNLLDSGITWHIDKHHAIAPDFTPGSTLHVKLNTDASKGIVTQLQHAVDRLLRQPSIATESGSAVITPLKKVEVE